LSAGDWREAAAIIEDRRCASGMTFVAKSMYMDLGSNDLNFKNQAVEAVYDNVNGRGNAALSVIGATAKLKF
jgi:hypothetical protein